MIIKLRLCSLISVSSLLAIYALTFILFSWVADSSEADKAKHSEMGLHGFIADIDDVDIQYLSARISPAQKMSRQQGAWFYLYGEDGLLVKHMDSNGRVASVRARCPASVCKDIIKSYGEDAILSIGFVEKRPGVLYIFSIGIRGEDGTVKSIIALPESKFKYVQEFNSH